MFALFKFRLPTAVTEQLIAKLDELTPTQLTGDELKALHKFQDELDDKSGVYVIFQDGKAVYAGKANDLYGRLMRHFNNLRGRKGVNMRIISYKALFLDENWSASANEGLLISHYKDKGFCSWNGKGFGPKDTGGERDDSKPNWFDSTYPINDLWPITLSKSEGSAVEILNALKTSMPYLLRFELREQDEKKRIDLSKAEKTMRGMMIHIAQTLGSGYQLMLFNNRVTLYHGAKTYKNGKQLYPQK